MITSFASRAYCLLLFTLISFSSQAQLTANFSANPVQGCSPLLVNFKDQSTGNATKWKWDLGNGTISYLQNPSVTYFNPGHYTIRLVISNATETDSVVKTRYIDVALKPTVKFTASSTSGCFPLPVQFTDQSIGVSDSVVKWQWDFGDGYSSSEQHPLHIYKTSGNFNATLRVFNAMGCMNTLSKPQYIKINSGVKANFTNTVPTTCTAPITISFQNTSTGVGTLTYKWLFGDGSSSALVSPNHTYTSPGNYTVKLVVINAAGCRDTLTKTDAFTVGNVFPGFSFSNINCLGKPVFITNTSSPLPTSVSWDFGDGTYSTGINPMKRYADTGTYQIKMVANFGSCVDSVFKTITVIPSPKAAFIADDSTNCTFPFKVNFINQSLDATSYHWNFGDNTTSDSLNPVHTYNGFGNFTVQLIVTRANGCTDTITRKDYIKITKPKVVFKNLPDSGCVPYTKYFSTTLTTVDPVSNYLWDFGDGATSTEATPTHTYTVQGIFTVKVMITTAGGCIDSAIMPKAIITNSRPVVNFSASPLNTCASTVIKFKDESSSNAIKWLWDFGDGSTSTSSNPLHMYNDTGFFDIQLIAWNSGCPDTVKFIDYVYVRVPIARYSETFDCTKPLERVFTNRSTGADEWKWNFGDGTTSTEFSPIHTYSSPGDYFVSLVVKNKASGCEYTTEKMIQVVDIIPSFFASDSIICRGNTITFNTNLSLSTVKVFDWNFGDGISVKSSTSSSIAHLYKLAGNYNVRLITTDILGCKDTLTKPTYLRIDGPTAKFTSAVPGSCLNTRVIFNDASTDDGQNPIKTWSWNYGDATMANLTAPPFEHNYTAAGAYTVKLKVIDSKGCADSINIVTPLIISKPVAKFTASDSVSCPSGPIVFSNQSTGPKLTYLWNFGDGVTDTAQNASHRYIADGRYTVNLFIRDQYGCTDSMTKTNIVSVVTPVADFTMSDSFTVCPPLIVQFTNLSLHAVSQTWDFGDGSTAAIFKPSHFYSYPGLYTVTLTVTAKGGCTAVMKKDILVNGPKGKFVYTPNRGCNPVKVSFSATTEDRTSFIWDFNDGTTLNTTDSVLSYNYTNPGIFLPKMILIDKDGCQVPVIGKDTITVNWISSLFNFSDKPLCDKGNVSFFDSSISNDIITGYLWQLGDGSTSTLQNPEHHYASTGTYYPKLTVTTENGCVDSLRSSIPVKVVASPKINITSTANGCTPLTVTFKGIENVADTSRLKWSWTFGNGNSALIQNPAIQQYNIAGVYNTNLLVTNSSGCTSTASKTVEAYLIPTVNAGVDTTICNLKGIILKPSGAATYTWSPAAGLSCTNCENPFAMPDSARNYIVKGSSVHGCSALDTVLVKLQYPFKIKYSQTDTLCVGQNTKLFASGADRFQWSPSTGLNKSNIALPIATPNTTINYRVVGQDNWGCFADTGYVMVKVYPVPTIEAGEDKTINVGETLDLIPVLSADVTTVIWSPNGDIFRYPDPYSVTVKPNHKTEYTVEVKNQGGCMAKDNVTVHVICNGTNVFIPNTFSPNGDGTNELFYPRGTGLFKVKSMRLFNRWGEMVFEKNNFNANDAAFGWNGTYKGVKLGSDVFVYMIDIICDNNTVLNYKGNVALLQ
jgi:gliding motility-associated-like protein